MTYEIHTLSPRASALHAGLKAAFSSENTSGNAVEVATKLVADYGQDHPSVTESFRVLTGVAAASTHEADREELLKLALQQNKIIGKLDQGAVVQNLYKLTKLTPSGSANDREIAEQLKAVTDNPMLKPIGAFRLSVESAQNLRDGSEANKAAVDKAVQYYVTFDDKDKYAARTELLALQEEKPLAAGLKGLVDGLNDKSEMTAQLERYTSNAGLKPIDIFHLAAEASHNAKNTSSGQSVAVDTALEYYGKLEDSERKIIKAELEPLYKQHTIAPGLAQLVNGYWEAKRSAVSQEPIQVAPPTQPAAESVAVDWVKRQETRATVPASGVFAK